VTKKGGTFAKKIRCVGDSKCHPPEAPNEALTKGYIFSDGM